MRPGVRAASLLILVAAVGCGGSKPSAGAAEPEADAIGGEECEPGRCMEDISALVKERRPEARACYETGHQRDPSLKGRLIMNFEIDETGQVVDASQSAQDDQIADEEVVACVADVIKRITFAPSKRGKSTRAFHRYEFSPP
jgi:hypothetical protein